jgi:hypothetical protein
VIDRAMKGKVKVTVIATGFLREDRVAMRPAATAVRPAVRQGEPEAAAPAVVRTGRPLPRRERMEEESFEIEQDEGYTPNFRKMKNDLDVPAFLRKQMD